MTSSALGSVSSSRGRLLGVDAARGVALLGMVATHVVTATTDDGTPRLTMMAFAGVSSALFVILAGMGLALSTGGADGVSARPELPWRRRLALRAAVLFALGLLVGMWETSVAIILCHYALMFLLALPLVPLGSRALGWLAGAWLVLGPVAVFALTATGYASLGVSAVAIEGRLWLSPAPGDLAHPGLLVADLVLTGYYPVLSWMGFLVLGLALGRMRWTPPRALRWGGAGALLWLVLLVVGRVQTADEGFVARLSAAIQRWVYPSGELSTTLLTGEHTLRWVIPDPVWLLVVSPHSGSVLEALRVSGYAVAVLGACLLLSWRVPRAVGTRAARSGAVGTRAVGELGPRAVGALGTRAVDMLGMGALAMIGRIPLTLYVGHIAALALLKNVGIDVHQLPVPLAVGGFWAGCIAVAGMLRLTGRSGPLEAGVTAASRVTG